MRKRLSIPFILLASIPLFSVANSAGACTGFAVYSGDSAWYGMNFDYPESSEIGFTVSAQGERIVFRMVFEEDGNQIPYSLLQSQDLPLQPPLS